MKTKLIILIYCSILLLTIHSKLNAQSTRAAGVNPITAHTWLSALDYIGWTNSFPLNFQTSALQRMIIDANGTNAASGYVGIGNNFLNPASRLHVSQGGDATTWFQLSGNNMGNLSTNGLRIGVLNPLLGPYDVEIRQQEIAPMKFFTNDISGIKERMRITFGVGNTAGLAGNNIPVQDVTKVTLSYGGAAINAVYNNPVAMFNIGNNPTAGSGFRQWMDVGTYCNRYSCMSYFGMKAEVSNSGLQDRYDAVVAWGDNPVGGGVGIDYLRFVFTAAGQYTGHPGVGFDGVEIARMSPNGNVGIGNFYAFGNNTQPTRKLEILDVWNGVNQNLPQLRLTYFFGGVNGTFTDFQATQAGDLFINPRNAGADRNVGINTSTPDNTLEIDANQAADHDYTTTALSGLRFNDLTNLIAPIPNPTNAVLSLDNDGDVILVQDDHNAVKITALENKVTELAAKINEMEKMLAMKN